MAEETLIAWTDHTFNGWIGCTKVSEGCRNCYAEKIASGKLGLDVWGPTATRTVTTTPWQNARMWHRAAARAGERRRVFCGSMMDWAEDHPVANRTRAAVWELVRECSWLDWQMLAKRPHRIRECLPKDWARRVREVWLGTSVEGMRAPIARSIAI